MFVCVCVCTYTKHISPMLETCIASAGQEEQLSVWTEPLAQPWLITEGSTQVAP